MTREGRFTIYADRKTLEDIETKVCGQIIKQEIYDKYIKIDVNAESPAYKYLQDRIANENLSYWYNELRRYTKREVEAASFYHVYLLNPWELDGKSEDDFNSDDKLLSGCPECGRGRVLKSDLYAQTSKLKNKDIVTLEPSIIVSGKVRNIIEECSFNGCEFGTVRDYRTKKISDYFQLNVKSVLPKMDSSVRIMQEEWCCKVCQEHKQNLESEVIYREEEIDKIQDFNLTQEYFGMGIPMQKLIVSKRVRDTFRKEKVRVIYYEPVRIID